MTQDKQVTAPETVKKSGDTEAKKENEPPAEKKRLVVSINQTEDKDRDIDSLHRVVEILKDFPGKDEVRLFLNINNGTKPVLMKLPGAGYCDELRQLLVELVGEDGLSVESVDNSL